jgi:hypothetical protein
MLLASSLHLIVVLFEVFTPPPQTQSEDDGRRTWHFRCDILDEMNTWMDAFSIAVNI